VDNKIKLEPSWLAVLQDEFSMDYMQVLRVFLQQAKQKGKVIYPPSYQFFSALNLTPFNQVKVVILGQDPYHGVGQAHGLCFSVPPTIKIPPSLVNIYKELQTDLGIPPASHGCLLSWARQGVLLLNSVLTVEQNSAASHQGKGWEQLTDKIIALLNMQVEGIVFILWGSYAQKKGAFIDAKRHLVLNAPHPSPLSAYRGFFGRKYFSTTNTYLANHEKSVIQWELPHLEAACQQFDAYQAQAKALYR